MVKPEYFFANNNFMLIFLFSAYKKKKKARKTGTEFPNEKNCKKNAILKAKKKVKGKVKER